MLRRFLLGLADNESARDLVTTLPGTRELAERYIAGENLDQVVPLLHELGRRGLLLSVAHLDEPVGTLEEVEANVRGYEALMTRLSSEGLTATTEVSVSLADLGLAMGGDGERLALESARRVCRAAANAGTMITVNMGEPHTVEATLSIVHDLWQDFPQTGVALQAQLKRTEHDCRQLAATGARIRLVKGGHDSSAGVLHRRGLETDRAYVRCLRVLVEGRCYPMVATHDPRLVEIAEALVRAAHRGSQDYEFQMLYGVRAWEQQRLVDIGRRVRVYLPYGQDWFGYFTRALADKPSNLLIYARSLVGRR